MYYVVLIIVMIPTNPPRRRGVLTLTDGRTEERTRDGVTGHFVIPDLPEHTTTRGASGPKIRNLVPRF